MFIINFGRLVIAVFHHSSFKYFNLRLRNAFIVACLGNFCYQNISLESAFLNYFSLCSMTKSLLSGTVAIIILEKKSAFLDNK